MNIASESVPKGTTHFLRYASGHIVWCKIDEGQNNQLVLSEWDSSNEYWVPGIHSVDFYQSIGLRSVDDFTVTMPAIDVAAAPKGATHCYNHGGLVCWYRESASGLCVWRDGSWYISAYKSAAELSKICPLGCLAEIVPAIGDFVENETQSAVLLCCNEQQVEEDDLTWLARNVCEWKEGDTLIASCFRCGSRVIASVSGEPIPGYEWFTRDQWLARRAELQNKPEEWPSNANWLAQDADGRWSFYTDHADNPPQCHGESAWYSDDEDIITKNSGEVLGDWRDTLERRPVDLSEPAGGVKGRGADGAEEINAMAQRLLVALKSEPRSFDTGALAEMVELADAEIVKRDAAVCGGEGYLNNRWFERGELPPVGARCEALITSERKWVEIEVVCHRDGFILGWCLKERCGYHGDEPTDFRPIRTEVDHLKDLLIQAGVTTSIDEAAAAILSAGFRRDGGAV